MWWDLLMNVVDGFVLYCAIRWCLHRDWLEELRRACPGLIQIWMMNGEHVVSFGEHEVRDKSLRAALKKAVKKCSDS